MKKTKAKRYGRKRPSTKKKSSYGAKRTKRKAY